MNTSICYTAVVKRQPQFYFEISICIYVMMFLHTDNKVSLYQLSDEVLIARVAQGDKTALEMLYDRHAATVLGMCLKILGNHTTAEKVLQETFWQVWQSAVSYPSQHRSFIGWLFKIARERTKEIVTKIE